MKNWSIIIAVIMLMSTWIVEDLLFLRKPTLVRKPFSAFPLNINGRWRGKTFPMKLTNIKKLQVNDYLLRIYSPEKDIELSSETDGGTLSPNPTTLDETLPVDTGLLEKLPVSFYVAYHKTQHTDSAYHSPKSCLPGSGWQIIDSEYDWIRLSENKTIQVNVVLIQKGLEQQLVFYWYQDRGRVIANEYWAKAYLIWDAAMRGRRDGALVRIMVPVINTKEDAFNQGRAFILDVTPFLDDYIPV